MNSDSVLHYVPQGTQQFGYGIDPVRRLSKIQQGMVMTRLREWATPRLHRDDLPTPSLVELRWSDDLNYLYVQKTSGLLSWGFDSMWVEHAPIREGENFAIFTAKNPAAHVILRAIAEASDPLYRRESLYEKSK